MRPMGALDWKSSGQLFVMTGHFGPVSFKYLDTNFVQDLSVISYDDTD